MASLNFKGKSAVWNHHLSVPYHTLDKDKKSSISGIDENENLLIEGDNLLALKALLPKYQGKIKCIYIDPPYNTGNEGWAYNDNVNNPIIKSWLGETVGKEGEDLARHDKWLCMITPRLKLLRELLAESGVIFISIDDNEQAALRMLCDEIFNEKNFIGNVVRKRRDSQANLAKNISPVHEYLLVYSKSAEATLNKLLPDLDEGNFKNPDNDKRGPYVTMPCTNKGGSKYTIITPTGEKYNDEWRFKEETYRKLLNDNRIVFPRRGDGKPRYKLFFKEKQTMGVIANTWWDNVATNQEGSNELRDFFGGESIFSNPKPVNFIKQILKLASKSNSVVLDFMAGSGTTGQAVLELNKEDNGSRNFILCTNNENNICTEICYPRIKKVIDGYKNQKKEHVKGFGGNLKYYTTDFVEAEPTDKNKRKLVKESTDMLCILENAFELIQETLEFKIFKNTDKYVGVIFYEEAIDNYKKTIKKIDGHFNTYVFSMGDDPHTKNFSDVKGKVTLCAIPEVILKVYREIFK